MRMCVMTPQVPFRKEVETQLKAGDETVKTDGTNRRWLATILVLRYSLILG